MKREPTEPRGFIKPNGAGIPRLQAGEEVKASKPLVSTGVAIAGAVVGIVLLAAIGIALAMASRRK